MRCDAVMKNDICLIVAILIMIVIVRIMMVSMLIVMVLVTVILMAIMMNMLLVFKFQRHFGNGPSAHWSLSFWTP